MKNLITLTLFAFLFSTVYSKAPIRFGKVTKDMLLMEAYEADTSASAVILCDYGEFDPDQFQFNRTLRIKILKKDGLDMATWTFPSSEKGMIRGKTFNLVDGKIETIKLDKKEDVYRERVTDKYYRLRVSMPNVKVGSVIDIEYGLSGLPDVWYFQYSVPVKHSELVIYDNPYIEYTKNFYGFESLDVNESYRWVMTDVPAFKSEKYMNNYKNYVSKFEIEISKILIPEMGINESYSTSWNAIKKQLYDSQRFGGKLSGNYFLKDVSKEILKDDLSDEEKIQAAVEHIKKVKWNGKKRLLCTTYSLNDRYEKKLANSAELNIMLIELLKDLGYEARPVVMSTRDNGILSRIYPSLEKLNYVLAHVTLNNKTYLLDATDRYLDPMLIPDRCLNYVGRIICNEQNEFINITAPGTQERNLMYILEMDSTGQIEGNLTIKNDGYAARDRRAKYYAFSSEEDFIIDFEKRNSSFSVKDYSLEGLKDTKAPLTENYKLKIDTRSAKIGSMVVLNPLFEERITENPFKLEKRLYPVDFMYPVQKSLIVNLKLPPNATVEELPQPTRFLMPDKSISVLYNVAQAGNNLQIMYRFKINKYILTEAEYPYLKQFFSALVEKHTESIIIQLRDKEVVQK